MEFAPQRLQTGTAWRSTMKGGYLLRAVVPPKEASGSHPRWSWTLLLSAPKAQLWDVGCGAASQVPQLCHGPHGVSRCPSKRRAHLRGAKRMQDLARGRRSPAGLTWCESSAKALLQPFPSHSFSAPYAEFHLLHPHLKRSCTAEDLEDGISMFFSVTRSSRFCFCWWLYTKVPLTWLGATRHSFPSLSAPCCLAQRVCSPTPKMKCEHLPLVASQSSVGRMVFVLAPELALQCRWDSMDLVWHRELCLCHRHWSQQPLEGLGLGRSSQSCYFPSFWLFPHSLKHRESSWQHWQGMVGPGGDAPVWGTRWDPRREHLWVLPPRNQPQQ